jgi:hypothetical protein
MSLPELFLYIFVGVCLALCVFVAIVHILDIGRKTVNTLKRRFYGDNPSRKDDRKW